MIDLFYYSINLWGRYWSIKDCLWFFQIASPVILILTSVFLPRETHFNLKICIFVIGNGYVINNKQIEFIIRSVDNYKNKHSLVEIFIENLRGPGNLWGAHGLSLLKCWQLTLRKLCKAQKGVIFTYKTLTKRCAKSLPMSLLLIKHFYLGCDCAVLAVSIRTVGWILWHFLDKFWCCTRAPQYDERSCLSSSIRRDPTMTVCQSLSKRKRH